jgi:DNA-binding NarL/FixJ family response regulator
MASLRRFLIISDNSNDRFHLSATLLRHYPEAVVQECMDLNTAIELLLRLAAHQHDTIVIAHRTPQIEGRDLVAALRAAHPSVPIVWAGAPEESVMAEAAGATRFLDRNAWLLIGKVVEDLVGHRTGRRPPTAGA